MKNISLIISVIYFLTNISFAQLSGSYTIGSGGDYSNISSAVDDLALNGISGNVVFNILDGNYNEQIKIPAISGVSDTDTIIFQSQSADTSAVKIYFGANDANENWVVNLDGCSYITFKNLTFQAVGGNTDIGVVIYSDAAVNNINFIDNHFIGKGTIASPYDAKTILMLNGSTGNSDILIEGNTLENCKYYIRTASSTNYTIINNRFLNPIITSASLRNIDNLLCRNNYIEGNMDIYYCDGTRKIYNNNATSRIDLYYNKLSSDFADIFNNTTEYLFIRNSYHVNILHNTVGTQISVDDLCQDITVANNLLVSGSTSIPGVMVEDSAAITYLNYNNIYTENILYRLTVSGTDEDYTDLASWQAATGFSEHSYSQKVFFDGDAPKVYTCQEPLTGTDMGITEDYEGDARILPVIGADEYIQEFFSATASDTIIKSGTEITFYADSMGGNLTWYNPDGTDISNEFTFTYTPATSGTFKVLWSNPACEDSVFINIVIDDTSPVLDLVSDFTVYLDDNGEVSISGDDIISSASDNTYLVDTLISQNIFYCNDIGTQSVDVTIIDAAGNSATESINVTVSDTISPELTVKNFDLYLNESGNGVLLPSDVVESASDNCALADTVLSKTEFGISDIGENIVTITINDESGNIVNVDAVVTVYEYSGISETNNEIKIYPNPAGDYLFVETRFNNSEIKISGISGRILYKTKTNERKTKINLNNYPKGIYIIETKNGKDLFYKKIVKK